MQNGNGSDAGAALFGPPGQVGVGRGMAEVRAGRPVVVASDRERLICLPVEGLEPARLAAFRAVCAPAAPRLVLTRQRARALGIEAGGPVAVELGADADARTILELAAEVRSGRPLAQQPAGDAAAAALDLLKLARVLPAVLAAETTAARTAAFDPPIVTVEAAAVARFRAEASRSLVIAGEAQVPLRAGMRTRFVVFRDALGDDAVAVVVGTPDLTKPVPVRIHSACLTGDVFGSRRCDCGDQLQLSLKRLKEAGGGIVLYLAQEGRGLGLANKMRAYRLQDGGLDTVDANTALGFDDDERDYGVAVRMLQLLGCSRVVLLTNNPAKLEGLASAGIDIAGRVPVEAPIHADNRRYLAAKAVRAGHKLRHVITALAEPGEDDGAPARLIR